MILNTEVKEGTPTVLQKTVKINNVNNISVVVTLTPSGDIKSFTQMLDNELSLMPGESKDARFVMSLQYGGRYDGKILVTFKPADPTVKATPVGLASTIIIFAAGPQNPNPPANETEEPTQPTQPNIPTEPNTQPQPTNQNNTQPNQQPTRWPLTQPSNQGGMKPNPGIGIAIILFVLIIGSIVYWWYMKR
jgi:hypothetical protein